MAPLNQYYSEECRIWLRLHPGRAITINEVGELYGRAFMKAACVETAVNGFRKSGLYPLNPHVFPEWMFQPSETTEILQGNDLPTKNQQQTSNADERSAEPRLSETEAINVFMDKTQGTSGLQLRCKHIQWP